MITKAAVALVVLLLLQAPNVAPPAPQFLGDQHLTTIFGKWTPEIGPLQVEDFAMQNLLVGTDRDLLMRFLSGGRVVIRGGSGTNTASIDMPRARLLVLFTGPVTQSVKLPLPDATNLLYVQDGKAFKRYPSDGAVLSRFIEFTPLANRKDVLGFMIDGASGLGAHGGSVSLGEPATTIPRQVAAFIPAMKIVDAAPIYPIKAAQARIEGTVLVEIVVGATGIVMEARVLRSLPLLDQAAIDCVKQWQYVPATVNGVPQPTVLTVSVVFKL